VPVHFSLTLLDDQGKQLDLIANTVGSTQGSKAEANEARPASLEQSGACVGR
jgi:hypothetical protein